MNNVSLIGRIGKDIELKYLPSGSAVASFTIAIDQSYKDKQGQKVEKTSWIDIVAFNGAETINKYFHKGRRIGITGELEQQTWKDQNGNNRSKIVVKLRSFDFIDKKEDIGQTNNSYKSFNVATKPTINIDDEEIPF